MATTFRIPKLTDREIAAALGRIRNNLKDLLEVRVVAHVTHSGGIDLEDPEPESNPGLAYIFDLHARVIPTFQLVVKTGNHASLNLYRKHDQTTDEATITDDWVNSIRSTEPGRSLSKIQVRLYSEVQRELKVDDLTAAFAGTSDNEWNRYRKAQMEVLNSLQQVNQRLTVDMARQIEEARSVESAKNEELRKHLRAEYESEQGRLAQMHGQRMKALDEREAELKKKLAEYETHEALYVARKKTQEQLDQLKQWLTNSSLTKDTVKKRTPVLIAYIVAMAVTAGVTAWYSYQSYELLKNIGPQLPQFPWWQWVALTAKAVVPLAAFTTFAIYLIRWEGAWARQHAEEELRTRARIIDIGRSSWLLEAVRDSKEGVSPALIGELSRNLFVASSAGDGADLHPQALSDLLAQGITSIKVKTPNGEVEASRGKAKR